MDMKDTICGKSSKQLVTPVDYVNFAKDAKKKFEQQNVDREVFSYSYVLMNSTETSAEACAYAFCSTVKLNAIEIIQVLNQTFGIAFEEAAFASKFDENSPQLCEAAALAAQEKLEITTCQTKKSGKTKFL